MNQGLPGTIGTGLESGDSGSQGQRPNHWATLLILSLSNLPFSILNEENIESLEGKTGEQTRTVNFSLSSLVFSVLGMRNKIQLFLANSVILAKVCRKHLFSTSPILGKRLLRPQHERISRGQRSCLFWRRRSTRRSSATPRKDSEIVCCHFKTKVPLSNLVPLWSKGRE